MKSLLISSILSFSLLSSLNAYELNGDLGVKWTGFKTVKKVPVSGSFNDIKLKIESSDNLSEFLKSSKVEIKSDSFESNNKERNLNITSTLFSLASSKMIEGSIVKVDEKEKKLVLNITMNQVTKQVPMMYEITSDKIIAKGTIDILDYNMENSFMAFAKKCATFHENKSFSDVDIEFTIPYK